MNSFEFTAIRKLQAERGDTDSQVAKFLHLVEDGSSLAPSGWVALVRELTHRADNIRCLDFDASLASAQEPTMGLPF